MPFVSVGPKPRGGLAEASPRTRALEVLIQASLDQLLDDTPVKANEGLLFLGNWHDALPRLLIQDPILQPVDKVVWQVIKLQAVAQGATGFPTYDQIARWANVASDTTVARAIAILRSTRWLTLCIQKARTKKGRFRGNVYALHDEPLSLGDTLHLDPEYMQFLCRLAAKPGEGRVGDVAKAVLGSIEQDIQEGIDVTAPRDAMTERMEAMRFITATPGQADQPAQRVFGVRRGFAAALQSRVNDQAAAKVLDTEGETDSRNLDLFAAEVHLQNLKMDGNVHLQKMNVAGRLQNLKSVPQAHNLYPQNLRPLPASCSSGSTNITTTTTYLDDPYNKAAHAREALNGKAVSISASPKHGELGWKESLLTFDGHGVRGGSGAEVPPRPISITDANQPTPCKDSLQPASSSVEVGLQFPAELSQNEIVLARIHLAKVPVGLQQEVLDLLGDRIRAAAAGTMEPLVWGPMGYLRRLCEAAREGKLVRRNRMEQSAPAAPPPAPPPPVDENAQQLKKLRDEHFNAYQWKQKLERIGPGANPTAEHLRVHQSRVDDASAQIEQLSQKIQQLLIQRPDLRPPSANGDKSPVLPSPGVRQ